MSNWDLVMQNTFLFPVLFFSLYLRFPPLSIWTKNNLDLERTLKILPSGQNPCWAYLSVKTLSATQWRLIFCLTMTSVIKRSPIYLQVVLKITNETFASVFGVRLQRLLILVKMRQRGKDEMKRKKKECGLLNLISDRLLLKAFPLPEKVPLEVVVSLPTVRIGSLKYSMFTSHKYKIIIGILNTKSISDTFGSHEYLQTITPKSSSFGIREYLANNKPDIATATP